MNYADNNYDQQAAPAPQQPEQADKPTTRKRRTKETLWKEKLQEKIAKRDALNDEIAAGAQSGSFDAFSPTDCREATR